jgi:hypothetical protein
VRDEFVDMGPIDYIVVEFPGNRVTDEGFPLLVDLVGLLGEADIEEAGSALESGSSAGILVYGSGCSAQRSAAARTRTIFAGRAAVASRVMPGSSGSSGSSVSNWESTSPAGMKWPVRRDTRSRAVSRSRARYR